MPELPEVEVARRILEASLVGATIHEVHAPDRMVTPDREHGLALVGRRVMRVLRRGKRLRIELDDGPPLYAHLGMSGKWVACEPSSPPLPWERARIDVTRGRRRASVRYVDPRRLGRIVRRKGRFPGWDGLGPDPLVDGLLADVLGPVLAHRRGSIKEALLDQAVLAGIGNIQATEALWFARIDPRKSSRSLSPTEVRALVRGLDKSIARTLAHLEGHDGKYVHEAGASNPFVAYGRKGEPCPRCGELFVRIVLGGRGTTLCRRCQKR